MHGKRERHEKDKEVEKHSQGRGVNLSGGGSSAVSPGLLCKAVRGGN